MCQAKDALYKLVKQDSRNAEWLGNALGWDYLEEEGKKNIGNPGRAVGKAAAAAATWYLGGLLGSGAGAAGTAAGETAGAAAEMTAEQIAAQLAEQAAAETAKQAAVEAAKQGASQIPQGIANTMETGLLESGYTPSSIAQAIKNTGETTPMSQNLLNYGKQKVADAQSGSLLNRVDANANDPQSSQMMRMGQGLLSPEQPQPQRQAPPQQQGPVEPLPNPYGNSLNSMHVNGPPPGMSWEEWLRRKQMMGMR